MSTLATTNLKNASSGSNNIVLNTDGTTTIAAPSNIIKSGTAVASTSGVAIDFTGLPSWVKRITLMFDGVSTNGTSLPLIQLGDSGGIEATGYAGSVAIVITSSTAAAALSTGFTLSPAANWTAAGIVYGFYTLTLLNAASNTWALTGQIGRPTDGALFSTQGTKSLSATLDRIRLTTTNGTDAFDAGSINILWEG